jgi:transcriptional regulator
MAAANGHWRRIVAGSTALVAVDGPDVYVSPSWYATKAEHGKVVPTWNYSSVHLSGPVTVIRDGTWLRDQIERLTDTHEADRSGWQVGDAPEAYVKSLLRAIVGVEIAVERVEGKAKLSQNRSEGDHLGVIAGLRNEATPAGVTVAEAMESGRMV